MIYRIIRAFQRVDIEKHGGNTVGSCSSPGESRVKECKLLIYLFVTNSILTKVVYCSISRRR